MRPLVFVLPHAIVFWVVLVWAFFPELKIVRNAQKESRKEGSKDDGSIKIIMITQQLGMFLSIAAVWLHRGDVVPEERLAVFYAGILLMVFGSLLRRLCWKTLGEYFTGDVKAREGQPVIMIGPYRWVRHPSYTAGMMMNIGVGFALTNWISVAVILLTTIVGYIYRVRVEERALLLELGAPYAEYMRTHKRFVPYII
jgi:protein-S-isoprenylcysteine O-methyltransferase Ste14